MFRLDCDLHRTPHTAHYACALLRVCPCPMHGHPMLIGAGNPCCGWHVWPIQVQSASACKQRCEDKDGCVAIEFNGMQQMCELSPPTPLTPPTADKNRPAPRTCPARFIADQGGRHSWSVCPVWRGGGGGGKDRTSMRSLRSLPGTRDGILGSLLLAHDGHPQFNVACKPPTYHAVTVPHGHCQRPPWLTF